MGVDIGAAYSKGVITEGDEMVAFHVLLSGANYGKTAERMRQELLHKVGATGDETVYTIATGSGAAKVDFAGASVSDLVCTARGINRIFPSARTVIDVAGQSTKVMRVDGNGHITNFVVSEKCATGSARFVEIIANVLRINLEEFGPLSLKAENPIAFSTGCAVFGESEAITRVAEGVAKEDIAAGVNKALAQKASSLIHKVKLEAPCALCGGGALNIGLIRTLQDELNLRLLVAPRPQITAALGAAILATASAHKG
jgi:predicted CoA-substrate-specific enzyme activase